jgi:hypothetical protein
VLEQTGFRKPEPGEDVVQRPAAAGADLFGGLDLSPASQPDEPETQPDVAEPDSLQETALNGAQVQAAADIIDRVVRSQMPPGTAVRMLVSMFNLPQVEAQAMVDEAAAFEPAPEAQTQ